jgi:hypothetical protein
MTTVCGWCPDKEQRTAEAVARGERVSHGMCPECSAMTLERLEMIDAVIDEAERQEESQ